MENKVLATVNGKEITEKDIELTIAKFPQDKQSYLATKMGKKHLLEQIISFELFYNYAKDNDVEKDEEYVSQIELMKKEILTQFAIKKVLDKVTLTDEEVEDYYKVNKAKFVTPATITASHVLVDSEEKAKEVEAKIKEGMSFEDAAKEFSSCPSKQQGGNLGAFARGQMVPEFEKVAFELEIGVVSEPVKTQFGYHLIKVSAKNEAKEKSFDEVKAGIKNGLMQERQNCKFMEFTNNLKSKYEVVTK